MALVRKLHTLTRNVLRSSLLERHRSSPMSAFDQRFSLVRAASTTQPEHDKQEVRVTFIRANGERLEAKGKIGDSLLDIVVNNEVDLDGYGACEGTLTCSTCHLIFPKDVFDSLPNGPTLEESDMLDLAYGFTETSRLGCQIIMTKQLDGLEVHVPATISDARG